MSKQTKQRLFDHVLFIMFENQYREYVMANPYFKGLARQGIDMQNFHGVMHPSQTNYIASIAGELCNVTDDDAPTPLLPQRTIVDLIEEAGTGLSWKAYMEGYNPQSQLWSADLEPADDYPYVIKHNPFSSYKNIVENPERWKKVVSGEQFWRDVINDNLPNYAWYTPNMWNDGHYTVGTKEEPKERAPALVDQAAEWLEKFFGDLNFPGPNSRLPKNTLVVVTFDESDFIAEFDAGKKYTYDGPNQVYTVLLGDGIKPAIRDEGYNHYSLIRTIEKNFNLDDLGKNDACANYFQFLWNREFAWQKPESTPMLNSDTLSSASLNDRLYVISRIDDNNLVCNSWKENGGWVNVLSPDISTEGPFNLITLTNDNDYNERLLLCYADNDGIKSKYYGDNEGWQTGPALNQAADGGLATLSLDEDNGLLMAWRDANGDLHSARMLNNEWQDQQSIGHSGSGALALSRIGASVYLVIEQQSDNSLNVHTYNTADYNTTRVQTSEYSGPHDDTVKLAWSPSTFPVARFGACAYAGTPKELEPVTLPYNGAAPIALAELDGVLHLIHPGSENTQLLTETFSIAGILTPLNKVSYKAGSDTTSNGYGTLAEAGWSKQNAVHGAQIGKDGGLTLTKVDERLVLLYSDGEKIKMISGGYQQQE